MTTSNYIIQRDKIVNDFSRKIKIWEDDFVEGKFNLVSAGLRNYLPHIDYKEHEKIFGGILMHQQLSMLEQSHTEALEYVTCESLDDHKWNLLKKGGAVVCTFHTGSYRIINHVLQKNKIPFTIVIANQVLKTQGEELQKLYQQFYGNGDTGGFRLIDAESPGSGLQMLRELKKGRNLVLYIDGNAGAGDDDNERNNCCNISFLTQRIFARKGIAFLAHVAKAPILTVACFRKAIDDIRLRFFEPMLPGDGENRETFAENATQKIYDLAASIITKYPEQWEAWMYLHKSVNIVDRVITAKKNITTNANENELLTLNLSEFGIFKLGEESYLFKKAGYESFVIDEHLYRYLRRSVSKPAVKNEIDADTFSELYENNVLVPV